MKKNIKLDFKSKLLIAAAVIIIAMICFISIIMAFNNKNTKAYEAKNIELQQTIGRLYQEMYLGSDESDANAGDEDYWYNEWLKNNEELNSMYNSDEDITDVIAKILFIRGVNKMWAQNISDLTKYPIAEPRVTTEIDGKIYTKRDVLYADVVDEYSKVFTGALLEERLNDSFIEIDGYLYVVAGGEDVGESVVDVEVIKVSEADGEFTYRVTYDLEASNGEITQENNTCTLVIQSVGNSFAISSLVFDKVEDAEVKEEITEEETTEEETTEQETTTQEVTTE